MIISALSGWKRERQLKYMNPAPLKRRWLGTLVGVRHKNCLAMAPNFLTPFSAHHFSGSLMRWIVDSATYIHSTYHLHNCSTICSCTCTHRTERSIICFIHRPNRSIICSLFLRLRPNWSPDQSIPYHWLRSNANKHGVYSISGEELLVLPLYEIAKNY